MLPVERTVDLDAEPERVRAHGRHQCATGQTRSPGGYFTGMCLMPAMKFERSGSRFARALERRHALRHLLEQHVDLHAGEVHPEAVVRAAAAEADVLVRVAQDVELERAVEDVLVAVRGDVPDRDLVALLQLLAAQLGVAA